MSTVQVEDYQIICEKGRLAAQEMDKGRWTIGDLACEVEKRYRQHTIDDFAREINVTKSSVQTYRAVCFFYRQKSLRYDFLEEHPNITFTHMKYATRLKTLDKAYDILETASAEGWTTDETAYHIGKQLSPASDSQSGANPSYTGQGSFVALQSGLVTIRLRSGAQGDFSALVGKDIEIIIKELNT